MYHESSEAMKGSKRSQGCTPLPFENLPVGKSFIVKFGMMQENSLRVAVSTASKKFNKRFKCIKHNDLQIFEIGCLPDLKVEAEQVFDSSDKMW